MPLLAHQIKRLKTTRQLGGPLILATTKLPDDDSLCSIATDTGISVFRGHSTDVVDRMLSAASEFGIDYIIELGGDDFFCEGFMIDAVVAHYKQSGADFIKFTNLPFGVTPFGVPVEALSRVRTINTSGTTDGWERFFLEGNLFRSQLIEPALDALKHPEIRLALDYPQDLELIRAIYERLDGGVNVPSLERVLTLLLTEDPSLLKLNQDLQQEWIQNYSSIPPISITPCK